MKFILPNGDLTYSMEHAKIEFSKNIVNIVENTIEFAPNLGFRRDFLNETDLIEYLSRKMNVHINDIKLEKVERQIGNVKKSFIVIKMYGETIGELKLY